MKDDLSRVSEQAVECFAHGLAHLMFELGEREGVRRAMGLLVSISDEEAKSLAFTGARSGPRPLQGAHPPR